MHVLNLLLYKTQYEIHKVGALTGKNISQPSRAIRWAMLLNLLASPILSGAGINRNIIFVCQNNKYPKTYPFVALLYRNKDIENLIEHLISRTLLPSWISIVIYVVISPVIVIIEEIYLAFRLYPHIHAVNKIINNKKKLSNFCTRLVIGPMPFQCASTVTPFCEMSESDQAVYKQYYTSVLRQNKGKLQFMAREASIQLIYQNAIVIYDFVYPPVREMDYSTWSSPYSRWITAVGLQLLSVVLSAYSTFNPIIEDLKFQSYRRYKTAAGCTSYLIKVLQILVHIIIATGVVYLLRGYA